ncbi:uncharacterized protein LAESUDRAFT_711818 [Laetiporus sulphureus 93-53]|uniref:Uncharacterized protein n=1 Tax=Laetiporus sulphureus 93-53 TaxID=1314785 RepID=A0A165G868_9APHY|nr:uncharacterized protein LAESUDRAFT_711818 [Laetiporus sulphureus 93-53]KZT09962.1 hypothetical protein LAESUDRAFT_711818 [Laetiporus sulphureus 93-53]
MSSSSSASSPSSESPSSSCPTAGDKYPASFNVQLTQTGHQKAAETDFITLHGCHFMQANDMWTLPAIPEDHVQTDDMRGLKKAVIEWLADTIMTAVKRDAMSLTLISPKSHRGFNDPVTGALLCLVELNWNDPQMNLSMEWHASMAISSACTTGPHSYTTILTYDLQLPFDGILHGLLVVKAFKHIFLGPSTANTDDDSNSKQGQSTCASNVAIHGMHKVNAASIAYAAVHIFFALSSAGTYSKTNKACDSVTLYHSVYMFFDDSLLKEEADECLMWWNHKIFITATIEEVAIQSHLQQLRAAKSSLTKDA